MYSTQRSYERFRTARTGDDTLDFLRKLGIVALDDQGIAHHYGKQRTVVGQTPVYRLIDESELLLTLFAAGTDESDAAARVRYLLADEVGLGKTIEAGLILRGLKLRGLVSRTLVIAPKGLVTQWVAEMQTHFEARILVSTDAGGEGLNLQSCHVVWMKRSGGGAMRCRARRK